MSYVRDGKCDECGSRNLTKDEYRGEIVCEDCGNVKDDYENSVPSSFTKSPQPGDKPERARPTYLAPYR